MAKGRQRQKSGGEASSASSAKGGASMQAQEAWRLFEAGDKVSARRRAQAILASGPTEADAREANELLDRLKAPQLAWTMAVVAAVVITGLILLAILRT